jgi:uncharacterized protein involved in exopolysaccharide biosynthesis
MQQFFTAQIRTAIFVFLLSGILTYGFTYFFITPKYESTAVIFPPNTHANIHLVSAGIRFGYDKEIGEQLEILNSTAVRNALVQEFGLLDEYGIDTNDAFYLEKLQKEYDRNISLDRTINKSINIIVRDHSPLRAAEMANRLVVLADEHMSEIVHKNVELAATSALASYQEKAALITAMTDSLDAMRLAGESVWTYGEERKSGRYQNYELQYRRELDRFLELKMRWEELDDLLNESVPKSYVVSIAIANGKPVYPKKGLLAMLAGALSVLVYFGLLQLKKST